MAADEERLNLTEKDWKELEEFKERNRQQRLEFVRLYAEWMKKTPNIVWSRQQNIIINKPKLRKLD